MARRVPFGMALCASRKSPEILAPAKIPVAAGKNMANTEKNECPSRKSGPKLVVNVFTANSCNKYCN
jgi:hypothetical protein